MTGPLRRAVVRRLREEAGTTMVEILTVVMIMGIMMGIAAIGLISYRTTSEHRATRDVVVSTLRHASERALSEQRTYCVQFTTTTWSLYRAACSGVTSVAVQTSVPLDSNAESLAGAFTHPAGHTSACGTGTCVYFYPRGNGSDGSLTISRAGRSNYTVEVEGLTSRVSTSE